MSKKMKLVPHLEYEKLLSVHKTPQLLHKSAGVNQFNRQQAAASEVLSLDSISDDIKLALFNNAMKGLRANFEALTNTPFKIEMGTQSLEAANIQLQSRADAETSTDPEAAIDQAHINENLLQMLPEKLRYSASQIMDKLSKSQSRDISWDIVGQVNFRGVKRLGANILDLLSYVIKPPSKAKPPVGISTFVYILKKLKVPTALLGIHMKQKLVLSLPALHAQKTPLMDIQGEHQGTSEEWGEQQMEEEGNREGGSPDDFQTPSRTTLWEEY